MPTTARNSGSFSPEHFILPELDLSISGVLLNPSIVATVADEPTAVAQFGEANLRPPWEVDEEPSPTDDVMRLVRPPILSGTISESAQPQLIDYSIAYRLDPQMTLRGNFNSGDWIVPQRYRFCARLYDAHIDQSLHADASVESVFEFSEF